MDDELKFVKLVGTGLLLIALILSAGATIDAQLSRLHRERLIAAGVSPTELVIMYGR